MCHVCTWKYKKLPERYPLRNNARASDVEKRFAAKELVSARLLRSPPTEGNRCETDAGRLTPRWIPVLKRQALDHFVVFGLAHFDHIVREFVDDCHDCCPPQGIGNRLIDTEDSGGPPSIECVAQLACESGLGRLLKTHGRAA